MRQRRMTGVMAVAIAVIGAASLTLVLTQRANSSARADGSQIVPTLDTKPAAGEAVQSQQVRVVDGGAWSMTSVRNAEGQLCAGEKVPSGSTADGGQGWSCWDPQTMFDKGPLNYSTGAVLASSKDYNVWVDGVAAPAVARLVLKLTDCTTIALPIDSNGVFHHVFSTAEINDNVGPAQLVAYDSAGTVIAQGDTKLAAVTLPASAACSSK